LRKDSDIIFVGHTDAQKRKELLGNASTLLHPIYFNEPFGLSVAEAMFCGTPVIAYNHGSMPELINNNVSGFLVNNANESIDAVRNLSAINRKKCCDYATEKFSYEKMINAYIEVYEKILSI
jgi:glycosyltransferase involved in cell wall biosynthesis